MTRTTGNLALKWESDPRRPAAPMTGTPDIRPFPSARELALRRQRARRRAFRLACMILCTAAFAGLFGSLVYRQSEIMRLNYENTKIAAAIRLADQSTRQIREELAGRTDLERIRALAIERLGMQDPGTRQIVRVDIPRSDRLVTSEQPGESTTEARLQAILENLEGFFRTIR